MSANQLEIASLAVALGAVEVGGPLSEDEQHLVDKSAHLAAPTSRAVRKMREQIRAGQDPLGDLFYEHRDAATRRGDGAVYTPEQLIEPMVKWALEQSPARIVDAGCGSGRFVAAIARRDSGMHLVAVDLDPLATLMTRAVLAVLGVKAARVLHADYTVVSTDELDGVTAFVGNPPYVRHHQLPVRTKEWAQFTAARLGHKISGLAGLHALFFLATASLGRPGDIGCFVTSAEWLDVNYGSIMRELLLDELGGESIHVLEPTADPFEGTMTTAVITAFKVGTKPASIRLSKVDALNDLGDLGTTGQPVSRERLAEAPRWSVLLRAVRATPVGFVELGELCRVHRGAVTGANATWVRAHSGELPETVLYRSVTRAKELFAARTVLSDDTKLKLVVDIPTDLDELEKAERKTVERFIREAKKQGVDKGYIASHRRAWWSVGLKKAAPILATYMARQVPAFVLNGVEARHINIAHGLYPREVLDDHALGRLALALRSGVMLSHGRVYAGGLTKFEPREMERLMVPDLDTLRGHGPLTAAMDS